MLCPTWRWRLLERQRCSTACCSWVVDSRDNVHPWVALFLQAKFRKAALLYEVSVTLLPLVEFLARHCSWMFTCTPDNGQLNATRLQVRALAAQDDGLAAFDCHVVIRVRVRLTLNVITLFSVNFVC